MPEPLPGPEDEAFLAAADRYLTLVQSGDRRGAAALLAEHPALAELTDCFDALDSFAASAPVSPDTRGQPAAAVGGPDGQRDFGDYELLEEVGRGGMGVVYKARERGLNRVVAVKMILSSQLAAADDVRRFQREAHAAGQLRHPHIVGIYRAGQVHGQHYFAMEYVAGRSLAQVLEEGPLPPEQAARLLSQVARAVDYLHGQGIVHRDLKPSNILIDQVGAPYVTDFGLAKIFQEDEDRTQSGMILGTPGFMPPEQAAGRVTDITPRSDVYSLGAILYAALCGRPPFRDENPLNTLLQVLESEPTRPNHLNPQIPAELERICLRCLEKSPERRFDGAGALADELDRFLRQEPLETRPSRWRDRVRRWVRRDTGLVARLAILLAAVIIVEAQHLLSHKHWAYLIEVKLVFALWTALAFAFQWLLRRPRTEGFARLAWAATDPLLLMVVLSLLKDEVGPLMIGYPLIVAASGLWFRVRLVVISTIACITSFGLLLWLRNGAASEPLYQPHYPVIFIVALAVIGWIVAFQVHRVRTLSRYFEQNQGPRGA